MKRYFVLCALAVMLGFGSTAKAQDACHPFYIGASTGVAMFQDQHDNGRNIDYDAGLAFSAFLGWNEGPGRLEMEYGRFNNDIDNNNPGHGNADLFIYMMNGYLDFPLSSRLTGYVGGGLGVAQAQVNNWQGEQVTTDFGIAYQAKVGASLALTNRADLFGGYRFLGTEQLTAELGGVDFGDQSYLHSLETGLRFKF